MVNFDDICEHKEKGFSKTSLKLTPGQLYCGGCDGNLKDEIISKLMNVGNSGGIRVKTIITNKSRIAYIVLVITHHNNDWEDSYDDKDCKLVYYGDNKDNLDMFATKHKGNKYLEEIFNRRCGDEIPVFVFQQCKGSTFNKRDFKYIGMASPSRNHDAISICEGHKKGIYNYKATFDITYDEVNFKWMQDLLDDVNPYESKYCPNEWKLKRNDIYYNDIHEIYNDNEQISITGIDGKKRYINTTKYERNTKLRNKAIELHGSQCQICGFNFKDVYGDLGDGFIEVHHINPLFDAGESFINPYKDLICVCSNCHRMFHRSKNKIIYPEQLKTIIETINYNKKS